jgi:hypothetical protein
VRARYSEAVQLYEQALAIFEKALGERSDYVPAQGPRPDTIAAARIARPFDCLARSSRASFAECREPTKKEGPEDELRPKL